MELGAQPILKYRDKKQENNREKNVKTFLQYSVKIVHAMEGKGSSWQILRINEAAKRQVNKFLSKFVAQYTFFFF